MVAVEFQAVVLAAGRGNRLPEFTGSQPKCLLPVGPFPLVWYPLQMLQKHGFEEAIVIVLESQKSEIQQAVEKTQLKLKLDFVPIPNDEDFGTADSLRYVHDKIKTDFIVVSCDVITNFKLYPLINKFRQHNASVAALLFPSTAEVNDMPTIGPKTKYKPEKDLFGIHPDSERLMFLASAGDFEETMSLSGHLLRKIGKLIMHSQMVDSHIYVMKKWIVDFLKTKEQFATIKGELLPYIIKKQLARNPQPTRETAQSEIVSSSKVDDNIFHHLSHSKLEKEIISASLFNDSRTRDPYNGDVIRCYAIHLPPNKFGVRANMTQTYTLANQKIFSIWDDLIGLNNLPLISTNAVVNCTQHKDIAVAENANISEKTRLTASVFGSYCNIAPKVTVTNSIIMGHATIEEGCVIENSIIGHRATIRKRCHLKNCLVGNNFTVEEGSSKTMALLSNDGFMEI